MFFHCCLIYSSFGAHSDSENLLAKICVKNVMTYSTVFAPQYPTQRMSLENKTLASTFTTTPFIFPNSLLQLEGWDLSILIGWVCVWACLWDYILNDKKADFSSVFHKNRIFKLNVSFIFFFFWVHFDLLRSTKMISTPMKYLYIYVNNT